MTRPSGGSLALPGAGGTQHLGLARVDAAVLVAWACWLVALVTVERVIALSASSLPLFPDEAQYWAWGRDLAFGYYSKPPLIAWVIRATTAWAGDTEFGVRLAAPLMHAGTAFIIIELGRRLFGDRVGAWAGAIYVTLPGVWVSAMLMSTDVPVLLFYGALLLCLVRALEDDRWRWWLGLGVALGLGMLAKYTMAVALPGLALFALLSPPHRRILVNRRFWAALALGCLIFLPNLVWNLSVGLLAFRAVGEAAALGDGGLLHLGQLMLFVAAQFALFGPALLPLLAAGVVAGRRWLGNPPWALLVAFILPQALVILAEALLSRAHANWAAVIYVPGTLLAVATAARWRWGAWVVVGSLAAHTAAGLIAQTYHGAVRAAGIQLTRETDPYSRLLGWDRLGHALGQYLARDPGVVVLTDDRNLFSEIAFYVKPRPTQVEWDGDDRINNQFELSTSVRAYPDARFLLVTAEPDPGRITRHFAQAEAVSVITIPIYPGFERRYTLWELTGLKPATP